MPHTMNRAPSAIACKKDRVQGASLVEVLVALIVLSVGLLGLAALQARTLRGNISSLQRTQAVMVSQYIMDLMQVDRVQAQQGQYNTPGTDFTCAVSDLPAGGLATAHLTDWLTTLKAQMGQPGDQTTCGQIFCQLSGNGICKVQIRWDDSASGGLAQQILSVDFRL